MNSATASTPLEAINSGYCCAVAPMAPCFTLLTPGQPPSTATTNTPFSLPAALRRRFVDRIDDVDLGRLLKNLLHRVASALIRAPVHVRADNLRTVARGI